MILESLSDMNASVLQYLLCNPAICDMERQKTTPKKTEVLDLKTAANPV